MNEIEALKGIHYKMKDLLDSQSWEKVNKFIKEIWATNDVNKMKMILIATSDFVNHLEIGEWRYRLYKRFNNTMGWPHKEWPLFKKKDPNVPIINQIP
jgi:hypothetical protein